MAKIHTEAIVLTLSKLVKSDTPNVDIDTLLTAELISSVEQVAQELAGSDVIVEVSAGEVDSE